MFQSSLGPKAERYEDVAGDEQQPRPVSILARPEGRALLPTMQPFLVRSCLFQSSLGPKAERYLVRWMLTPATRPAFQSSLGPKAERYVGMGTATATTTTFQSSLGPKAERYSADARAMVTAPLVSILARPEGRALPRHCPGPRTARSVFQSSLGPKAERYSSTVTRWRP